MWDVKSVSVKLLFKTLLISEVRRKKAGRAWGWPGVGLAVRGPHVFTGGVHSRTWQHPGSTPCAEQARCVILGIFCF